ncbi:hypothetical protein AMTRI_Chr06g171460 [Amborella trichopoda]
MHVNLDMRCTINLEMGSNLVGSGIETSTKVETPPIDDYPTELDYDNFGYDTSETNMDEPLGFEFSDDVPKEDFKSHNNALVIASRIEKQMTEIYTPSIFSNFFELESMQAMNFTCKVQEEDMMVTFRNIKEKATCSCHIYERMCIHYSHILNCFFSKNILELPQYYIMKRWTKIVTKGIALNNAYSTCSNDLFQRCNILSINGAMSVGVYEYAKIVIYEACNQVGSGIDMKKGYVIQTFSTHGSPTYT